MINKLAIGSYILLYITVVTLWLPKRIGLQVWQLCFCGSLLLALISHQIAIIALVPIILLIISIYLGQNKKYGAPTKIFLFVLSFILSIGLAIHIFPGFHNLKIFNQIYLSTDAIPFSMYLNFDKTIVGVLILGISQQLISSIKEAWSTLQKTIPYLVVTVVLLIIIAVALKFVRFDPKLPSQFLLWSITNLLLVTTAEEAFFRGYIQKNLAISMSRISFGKYFAIIITAVLFGAAHYLGGIKYIALATIAGACYGLIYEKTKHIESCILTHFSLNLIHFLFFTYPMLKLTP